MNRKEARATQTPTLKTLLMTDLVDSTRLTEKRGDKRMADIWLRHDRLARDLLQQYDGREVDRTDGFLMLFDRPLDAVRYALAFHQAMDELAREVDVDLAFRLGIHFGEVVLIENSPEDMARGAGPLGVEGLAKPIVARIQSLALGRQTLLSSAAFDLARRSAVDQLPSGQDWRWLVHGEYLLKGVTAPVQVCEVGVEGRAPLKVPKETEKVRRAGEQLTISGWRPAPGLDIPGRSNWALERRLGEGGLGEVWLASHKKTTDRRVFKFCYEVESLRSLLREITLLRLLKEELGNREDIVRVLDWNLKKAPYFIESAYTDGGSLPDWVAERGGIEAVPLMTRLEIVAQVSEALAAAHSVGVLHKDIKPANILISTDRRGRAHAQLIDFGVGRITEVNRLAEAGITDPGLTELVNPTGSAQSGTRIYMAPEVLEGKPATLQGDVYALGVVLYQLLVGNFGRSLSTGWEQEIDDELLREDIAAAADGLPRRRLSNALRLAERLRGLKERRIERQAQQRAQSRRKLYKVVAVTATVVLPVVSVLAFWALNARQQEKEARLGTERVLEFMVGLFEEADPFGASEPDENRGKTVTAREIIDRGAVKLESGFEEEPLIRARLMNTVGGIYRSFGLYVAAKPLLEEALASRQQHLGDEHPEVAESMSNLALLLYEQGDYAGAEPLLRETLAIRHRVLGDEHPDVAESMDKLAGLFYAQGDYASAEPLYRKALTLRRRVLGDGHPGAAGTLNNLATLLHTQGDYAGAEPLYREALTLRRRVLGDEHPYVAISLNDLGALLRAKGDYIGAEPLYHEALAIQRRVLGNEHPDVALTLNNLAALLQVQGDYAGAETLYREALELWRQILDEEHPSVAKSLNNLALLLQNKGDYAGAETLYRESLALRRRIFGEEHPDVATSLNNLAFLLQNKGDYSGAEPLYRRALLIWRRALGDEHPNVAATLNNLASLMIDRGEPTEAEKLIRQALEIFHQTLGPDHWRISNAESILGSCFTALGRYDEAETFLLKSYPVVKDQSGEKSNYTQAVLQRLITLYEVWGKPEAAAEYQALWIEAGGSL